MNEVKVRVFAKIFRTVPVEVREVKWQPYTDC